MGSVVCVSVGLRPLLVVGGEGRMDCGIDCIGRGRAAPMMFSCCSKYALYWARDIFLGSLETSKEVVRPESPSSERNRTPGLSLSKSDVCMALPGATTYGERTKSRIKEKPTHPPRRRYPYMTIHHSDERAVQNSAWDGTDSQISNQRLRPNVTVWSKGLRPKLSLIYVSLYYAHECVNSHV